LVILTQKQSGHSPGLTARGVCLQLSPIPPASLLQQPNLASIGNPSDVVAADPAAGRQFNVPLWAMVGWDHCAALQRRLPLPQLVST
jgi:hypothetical protein